MQPDAELPDAVEVPPSARPAERAALMGRHIEDAFALQARHAQTAQASAELAGSLAAADAIVGDMLAHATDACEGRAAVPTPFEHLQLAHRLHRALASAHAHLGALDAQRQRLLLSMEDFAVQSIDAFLAARPADQRMLRDGAPLRVEVRNPTLGDPALHADDDAPFGTLLQLSLL